MSPRLIRCPMSSLPRTLTIRPVMNLVGVYIATAVLVPVSLTSELEFPRLQCRASLWVARRIVPLILRTLIAEMMLKSELPVTLCFPWVLFDQRRPSGVSSA